MNTEFFCNATFHQAVYVVSLVPKQRKHQHGHLVTDTLVDAMGAAMGDEDFSFRVG